MSGKAAAKEAKKGTLWQRIKKNKDVYYMLAPGLFFLIVFSLYPIAWILKYMFYHYTSFGDLQFVGFENFMTLAKDPQFYNAIWKTLIYAVGKIIITIPISFLFAFILNLKLKGRSIFRSIFFVPTIISVSVMSMVFYLIFNPYNGSLNQILKKIGLISMPVNWFDEKHVMITVLAVAIWGAVGNYMLYFLSGLQTIPEEIYESAALDGAYGWKKLWYITLPMMSPILQTVIMLAITQAFKDYENILVLTSGGPNRASEVLYLYIYRLMFPTGDSQSNVVLQYGYGATVAFVTAILVGIITVAYLKWSKKMSETF